VVCGRPSGCPSLARGCARTADRRWTRLIAARRHGSSVSSQLTGGVSLIGGGGYGRVIGIFAATLGAIESLLSIGGKHPWWAIGIFVVCLWVLHGLIVYSEDYAAQP
jgi:hypothetical protein